MPTISPLSHTPDPTIIHALSIGSIDNQLENSPSEDLKKVGQQFGEIMMREILKSALKPMNDKNGLLGGKQAGSDVQFGLLVDTMAQAMAQGQSFGFDTLLQQSIKD